MDTERRIREEIEDLRQEVTGQKQSQKRLDVLQVDYTLVNVHVSTHI
jgi:hypothetical protein